MIKLHDVNKYFFKGKSNSIHVINLVTLTLESTGLVVILGKSGSGKTTLLNVIGGLDSARGTISYDGQTFERYRMNEIDAYRNEHIGYVFQNYLLLNDVSVSENIGLSLRMAGYTDADEIQRRTNAALDSVGMLKYKRRLASALSGGQQQRVAIARALAKDASIIIADEPTGNLDSENSYEILCILKKLSETRLVILVTHNEILAHDFADRIIGYSDGQIVSDVLNADSAKSAKSQASLNKLQENKVYLQELETQGTNLNGISVTSFSDEKEQKDVDLKVVTINGKTYLLFDENKVQANPNIQFIDAKSPLADESTKVSQESKLDTSGFHPKAEEKINVWKIIKNALIRFFRPTNKRTKLFNISMAALGATLALVSILAYSTISNYSTANYFNTYDQNAVYVDNSGQYGKEIPISDFADIISDSTSGVTGSLSGHSSINYLRNFSMLRLPYDITSGNYYDQIGSNYYAQIYGYPSLFGLDAGDIVAGTLPDSIFECTIDQSFITEVKNVYNIRSLTNDIILGSKIKIASSGQDPILTLTIVGITDAGAFTVMLDEATGPMVCQEILADNYNYLSRIDREADKAHIYSYSEKSPASITSSGSISATLPNVWVSSAYRDLLSRMGSSLVFNVIGYYQDDDLEMILASDDDISRFIDSQVFTIYDNPVSALSQLSEGSLASGRLPSAAKEIVVSKYLEGHTNQSTFGYTVVGYANSSFANRNAFYGTNATCEYQLLQITYQNSVKLNEVKLLSNDKLVPSDLIISNDVEKTINFFTSKGHKAIEYGDYVKSEFLKGSLSSNRAFIITFIIMISVIILLFYMTTRSKMIKNIYPIGVYRSLGTKRGKIMRLFLSDTLVQATFTNVLAFVMVFIIADNVLVNSGMKIIPIWILLAGLVFSFLVPLFATWLPLAQLLAKTPHQITTKYDI